MKSQEVNFAAIKQGVTLEAVLHVALPAVGAVHWAPKP